LQAVRIGRFTADQQKVFTPFFRVFGDRRVAAIQPTPQLVAMRRRLPIHDANRKATKGRDSILQFDH
jgi:hypothetical protein